MKKFKHILASISLAGLLAGGASAQEPMADKQETESPRKRPSPEQIQKAIASLTKQATDKVIYRNLSLIDGTGAALQANMAIIVDGDHIVSVKPDASLSEADKAGANIYDAAGLYALPGLVDSHAHLATLPSAEVAHALLKRQLYSGLTSVRDMAGDVRALADLSRAAMVNEIDAPDIFYASLMAGPSFFNDPRTVTSGLGVVPGKVPWMMAIDDDTDLPLAVAQARGTSATGIKIYANLPGKNVREIIAEGKRQGIPVWTHIQVYPASVYDSLGATTVSHVCSVAAYAAAPNTQRYSAENPPSYDGITLDHPEIKKYIKALKKSGTILDATLYIFVSKDEDSATPAGRVCPSALAGGITKAAHDAGVPIVAGTDAQSDAGDDYPALHLELETLVKHGGLTPHDAIISATANAARAVGKEKDYGTIEPGKFANIVLVKNNPLDDISNLRSVELTVKRGNQYPRSNYKHQPIPTMPFPDF